MSRTLCAWAQEGSASDSLRKDRKFLEKSFLSSSREFPYPWRMLLEFLMYQGTSQTKGENRRP